MKTKLMRTIRHAGQMPPTLYRNTLGFLGVYDEDGLAMKFISTRIGASLTFAFLIQCPESRAIHADSLPPAFSACRNLESCLNALDPKASISEDSIGSDEEAIAAKLFTFGEPAKIELLKRAAGDNAGWRNLSQSILYNWKIWSPSDVPELQAALRRDPGGWMARPLANIATPAAIEALVEDLPKGSDNQTDFALEAIGLRAVPALMTLLENADTAPPALRVIKSMGESVSPCQVEWVQTATNATKPLPERLAALRAISALGAEPDNPLLRSHHSRNRRTLRYVVKQ